MERRGALSFRKQLGAFISARSESVAALAVLCILTIIIKDAINMTIFSVQNVVCFGVIGDTHE